MLALLTALGVPRAAAAQSSKPSCLTERTFSDWNAQAFVTTTGTGAEIVARPGAERFILNSSSVSAAEFKYLRTADAEHYIFRLDYRQRPTTLDHVARLQHASGWTKEALITRFSFNEKNGVLELFLGPLFPDTDHPMRRSGTLDIVVTYAGAPVVTAQVGTATFMEARAFTVAEAARLKQEHDKLKCEVSRCFLTAACCAEIGLADDCFELSTLRAFRDGPLRGLPGGTEDIAHYYATAPAILAEMRRRGETNRLIPLYASHILPSALAAHAGLNAVARCIYTHMMRTLEQQYLVLPQRPVDRATHSDVV